MVSDGRIAAITGSGDIDADTAPALAPVARPERLPLSHAQGRRPFDLGAEPPVRALLVTCGRREYRLLLTVHRIAFDDWSVAPLWRDLAAFYRYRARTSEASQGAANLPELPVQYADYTL